MCGQSSLHAGERAQGFFLTPTERSRMRMDKIGGIKGLVVIVGLAVVVGIVIKALV